MNLIKVVVKDGNIQKALQIFKKKVAKSGHIEELKQRKEFVKPSIKKHKTDQDIKHKRKLGRESKLKNPSI